MQYRHLPDVRSHLDLPSEAAEEDKLQAITAHIIVKCAEWIGTLLEDMANTDIKQASAIASSVAETTVTMFQQGTSHALQSWADHEEAAQNLSSFLGALGLKVQPCDGPIQAVHAYGKGDHSYSNCSGSVDELKEVLPHCSLTTQHMLNEH